MAHEIEIPMPWGYIAGKTHGDKKNKAVLCIHGFQDNAGTFDRLIPHLPEDFFWVAIDLPGQGKSSHFSRGLPLIYMDYVFVLKLVIDYFKWDHIIMLGHSLGAQLCLIFTALYPEITTKLVMLDSIGPPAITDIVGHHRKYYDSLQQLEAHLNKKPYPIHTYEEALKRMVSSRFSQLTRESAEVLIARSLCQSGNGVRFTTDQRLKQFLLHCFSFDDIKSFFNNVKCPTLLLIAEDSYNRIVSKAETKLGAAYRDKLSLFVNTPNFTFKVIEGNHDVHLNNAPLVAQNLIPFLLLNKSSL